MLRTVSVVATALLLTALAAAPPAGAVNSLTFTLVVPCDDPDGVWSNDVLPVTLPSGVLAYTITGECSFGLAGGAPVHPALAAACYVSVHAAIVWSCASVNPGGGCVYVVFVNGQCVGLAPAGVVGHGGGPVTASFADWPGAFYDNQGAFVVTFTLTPL